MDNLRTAAQQALEALERCVSTCFDQYAHEQVMSRPEHFVNQTITTLRAALAQQAEPVQEPFALQCPTPKACREGCCQGDCIPHTAPPQRKPEPVAWMVYIEDGKSVCVTDNPNDLVGAYRALPIYTAPPQRKPLTDEEIEMAYREIWRALPTDFEHTSSGWIEQGIKYAERAHGIGEAK